MMVPKKSTAREKYLVSVAVTKMSDLAYYLKQGDIDKIQEAFVKTKIEDREVAKQFALLTSKSYVISLEADTTEHCDNPHSPCFVSCIYKIKPCYGLPIRVIHYALNHYNVKPSTDLQISKYIETLEDLREAEFAQSSVDTISSSEPTNDTWNDLRKRTKQSVKFLKQSQHLTLSWSGLCETVKKTALGRMKDLHHYGICSAHVALLGLADCTIDELRSIPGIVVVFPTWVTLEQNLHNPTEITNIFEFIQKRHGSLEGLIFDDCVPLAPYDDYHASDLKTLQNIPVWEWGRIAVVHAWIRSKCPSGLCVKKLCGEIGLKQKYSRIMARLATASCRLDA